MRPRFRRWLRTSTLCLALGLLPGCAFLVAGIRELGDDGPNPSFEKKDYWGHFFDSLGDRPRRRGW